MATGTGNLPNQSMAFTPLDTLPASDLNKIVDNIEALADGTGIGDGAITINKVDLGASGYGITSWSNATGNYTRSATTFDYIDSTNAKVIVNIRKGILVRVDIKLGGLWNTNNGYAININVGIGNNTAAGNTVIISPASWSGNWSTDGLLRVSDTATFYLTNVGTGSKTFYPLWASDNIVSTAAIGQFSSNIISVTEIL